MSGYLQLALLVAEGCRPSSNVLEVGCGALHAGVPTMSFLDVGRWVGIDPNGWLREAAMTSPEVRRLVNEKHARFLSREDFDASELDHTFDYVLSHSILSHAAAHQLPQFLANTCKTISLDGRIVASVRLAEGNSFGSAGSPDGKDTLAREWVYPEVSFFTRETVVRAAEESNLSVEFRPAYTAFYTAVRPLECHDWVVFRRHDADRR